MMRLNLTTRKIFSPMKHASINKATKTCKKSFILLEVLVSFMLAITSGVLFLQFQSQSQIAHRKLVAMLELENDYEEALAKLIENLITNKIPWDLMENGKDYKLSINQAGKSARYLFNKV